jgi:transcriptional regulator GlxA family with amidase domain
MHRFAIALLMMTVAGPLWAAKPLKAPAKGKIPVAFVLTEGATMIDFAGPWEVFQDVHVESRGESMDEMMPFELYTVSEKTTPIRTSGGMSVVPDYTFANAPAPKVVVVGAQRGRSPEMMEWLRKVAKEADVVMSVCTGAFKLAQAGLLDGKKATTHHDFYDTFAENYPKVTLVKSKRFVVSDDKISTSGGLTSGIDLALHVVERYFGRQVAQQTAVYMEYESDGWKSE